MQTMVQTMVPTALKQNAQSPVINEPRPLVPNAPSDIGLLPSPEGFVDRQQHLQWLLEKLRNGRSNNPIVLYGLAGFGKTMLAARAIHQLHNEGRFNDGILLPSSQDLSDVTRTLRKILVRFDAERRLPETTNDMTDWNDITSAMLQGKDVLIVLDNLEASPNTHKLLAPLLTAGATVLITARHRLIRTTLSRKIGRLSPREALNLFTKSSGRSLTKQELAVAERIVEALGYHAFAVKLAGAQAVHRDMEFLARELEDPKRKLELPEEETETPQVVAMAFSESIKDLPPEASKLFVALAAFPTTDFSRQAVLTLANKLGLAEADFNLARLTMRALIEPSTIDHMPPDSDRERVHLHPLLQAFASLQFAKWSEVERNTAHQVIAQYYADYTNRIPHTSLSIDELNITGMLRWAHDSKEHNLEIELCKGMQSYWFHRSSTSSGQNYLRWGVEAATKIASQTQINQHFLLEADLKFAYAQATEQQGLIDEAEKIYKENLKVRRHLRDQRGEGEVLVSLVQIEMRRGRLDEAENYCTESMDITRKGEDRRSEGLLLGCMSELAWRRGRLEEAEKYSKESLAILNQLHEGRLEVRCLIRLGNILRNRGSFNAARDYYARAQRIIRDIQDRQAEGWLYRCSGNLAQDTGNNKRAEDSYQKALTIMREVQDQCSEGWVLGDLGSLLQTQKAFEQAEIHYQKALEIFRKVQDRHGEGWIQGHLGDLAQDRGQDERVEDHYREALKITHEGQDRLNYVKVALALGIFLVTKQGKGYEGCKMLREAEQIYVGLGLPDEERVLRRARSLRCP